MDGPRGTVTFLFTDIENSTRLWEENPRAMAPAVALHDAALQESIEHHSGTLVKNTGDGAFAAFATARQAATSAYEATIRLATAQWPDGIPLRARMGIHSGEAEERGGDYFGPAVIKAARIMSAASGGQILLSGTAAALVRGRLSPGWSLLDLGTHQLKGLRDRESILQLSAPGLEVSFPNLSTIESTPTNLPFPNTGLFGREEALASARERLGPGVLLTIVGPGGAGKTRLALEIGATTLHNWSGVWFVDLAGAGSRDSAFRTLGETVGVGDEAGRDRLEAVAAALKGQRILVILDNCEHLTGAAAEIADALTRRAGVAVLATSRESLKHRHEQTVRLGPLSIGGPIAGPAELVFLERMRAVRANVTNDEHEMAAIRAICESLDGIPLAIELAAARTRSVLPSQLAARLDQKLRVAGAAAQAGAGRQQTLRNTIEWSYNLLGPGERLVFERLAVFANPFTLEAAEAVCGFGELDPLDAFDHLVDLVDKSLVTEAAGPAPGFRLFETIKEYAEERLELSPDIGTVLDRHSRHYRTMVTGGEEKLSGPEQVHWFHEFSDATGNLKIALRHLLTTEPNEALAMAADLGRFWYRSGSLRFALSTLASALETAPAHSSSSRALALTWCGNMRETLGEDGRAELLEAVEMSLSIGDPVAQVRSMVGLGNIEWRDGDLDEAASWYGRANEVGRSNGLPPDTPAVFNLGVVGRSLGRLEIASQAVQDLAEASERFDDPWALSSALILRAFVAFERDSLDEAARWFEEARAKTRELGYPTDLATCAYGLALIAAQRGDTERLSTELRCWSEAMGEALDPLSRVELALRAAATDKSLDVDKEAMRALTLPSRHNDDVLSMVDAAASLAAVRGQGEIVASLHAIAREIEERLGISRTPRRKREWGAALRSAHHAGILETDPPKMSLEECLERLARPQAS